MCGLGLRPLLPPSCPYFCIYTGLMAGRDRLTALPKTSKTQNKTPSSFSHLHFREWEEQLYLQNVLTFWTFLPQFFPFQNDASHSLITAAICVNLETVYFQKKFQLNSSCQFPFKLLPGFWKEFPRRTWMSWSWGCREGGEGEPWMGEGVRG